MSAREATQLKGNVQFLCLFEGCCKSSKLIKLIQFHLFRCLSCKFKFQTVFGKEIPEFVSFRRQAIADLISLFSAENIFTFTKTEGLIFPFLQDFGIRFFYKPKSEFLRRLSHSEQISTQIGTVASERNNIKSDKWLLLTVACNLCQINTDDVGILWARYDVILLKLSGDI